MGKLIDLTGQRFDMVTVISRAENSKTGVCWNCRCDCGKEFVTSTHTLHSPRFHSCGCYTREFASTNMKKYASENNIGYKNPNYRHGSFCDGTQRLYWVWHEMIRRCSNHKSKHYADYGGRGISVCDEWSDFKTFKEWSLANGYKQGLSIDRINNDGDYEPSNCRWTTMKVQCNNRRKRSCYRKAAAN